MRTLYQLISDMQEKDWNYYEGFSIHKIDKPFVSEVTSKGFILEYFQQGGKEAITSRFDLNKLSDYRADHTISIFFLGLAIFHHTEMGAKPLFNRPTSEKYDFFHFIWFVTCLAHDFVFDIEKSVELKASCPSLPAMKAHLRITHDLSKCTVEQVPKYLFDACEPYFHYRYQERKAVDHGIYAGFLMYDALVKNRLLKHEYNNNPNLTWDPSLDAQYAYASATVAIHNIWFPTPDKASLYERYGLTALINKEKVSFKEAPLLYILAIVDTLDPVKAFQRHAQVMDILHNSFLDFIDGDTIILQISEKLNLDTEIENLKSKVKELEDWLNVSVTTQDREINIRIKT